MKPINWRNYRRSDGTIDLIAAAEDSGALISQQQLTFLDRVQLLQPINSRQAAAVAIATAIALTNMEREES